MNSRFLKQLFFSGVLFSLTPSILAFNPVDGNYGGIFIGVSYAPNTSFTLPSPVTFTGPQTTLGFQSGSLSHSVLGNVGGELGYRFCTNYRLEIEGMYNNNHFSQLTINDLTISSPTYNLSTPTRVYFSNMENTPDAHIQGDTNTGAFMINGFYDFFIPNRDGYSTVVPFVGLGIGYGYVQNALQFYRAQINANETNDNREIFEVWQSRSTLAGQAIAGINYFMDDFTWLFIDVRYWATKSNTPTSTYTIITPSGATDINSTINIFGKNTQLLSINLGFNGVFNVA